MDGPPFRDRTDAGDRLAADLLARGVEADVVLAIPRGGLPLGRAVADALDAPLDVVVAKKIGAPGNPEYAIGAVASDGSVWRNEHALGSGTVDETYFERERDRVAEQAREKASRYRDGDVEPDVAGKRVVLVDDGVATGSTVRACLRQLANGGATRVVLAIPVGPPDTVDALAEHADDVVCLERPRRFQAVGQFYDRFAQVTDEEALTYLDAGH
ncbi:phosphoribosyltransferase [Halorubellus sp. JP-L1]|uniref:phosphoribosyltransferase n=1 Tax=Halorubellus sp. JP-L1 TaxID=2715753 RepID=UPI00140C8C7D|nr:phosphoribosyltransferase family protein [Halorubellus sp. JP-L1]NHN43203.1 phosphoribosyltransferase [Halorubellus sp. JP-L1]